MERNKKNVIILSNVIAIYWFSQYMYIPFLTPHLLDLGVAALATGIIVGAYGLTQLCFRFPIGVYADYSQKYVEIMRLGILLSLASSVGFYFFRSPILLFVINFLQGLSSSTWLAFVILYSRLYKESEYQKAMGVSNSLNQGGIVLSYFVGGILIERIGIYNIFLVSAISAIVAFFLTSLLKVDTEKQNAKHVRVNDRKVMSWKEVFSQETIFYSIIGLLVMLTAFGTAFSFTSSVAKNLGASGGKLAFISMVFTIAATAGSFLVSYPVIQKAQQATIIGSCFTIMAACCIGIGITESLSVIVIAQVFEGIVVYLLFTYAMGKSTQHIENGSKSTAMGLFQTIYSVGIFLGPVSMGGFVEAVSLKGAFIITAIFPIIGIILNMLYFKLKKGGIPA